MYELWQLIQLTEGEEPTPFFKLNEFENIVDAKNDQKDMLKNEVATIITDKKGKKI